MPKELIQVRIDKNLKKEVSNIYENYGIDLPTAIRMFFKKTVAINGIPFDVRSPEQVKQEARWAVIDQARKEIQDNNVPEMSLEEINAEIVASRTSSYEHTKK